MQKIVGLVIRNNETRLVSEESKSVTGQTFCKNGKQGEYFACLDEGFKKTMPIWEAYEQGFLVEVSFLEWKAIIETLNNSGKLEFKKYYETHNSRESLGHSIRRVSDGKILVDTVDSGILFLSAKYRSQFDLAKKAFNKTIKEYCEQNTLKLF